MRLLQRFSSLLVVALVGTASTAIVRGQQSAANPSAAQSTSAKAKAQIITEDALKSRFVGKMVFVRGFYVSDDLSFDMNGKVNGSPSTASFTLSALEVRKVSLSKKKAEFEADRYALHFSGALPYEDDSKSFDKVKISKKPVRISIDRELVVVPKVKKEKKDKNKKSVDGTKPGSNSTSQGTAVTAASTAPATVTNAPGAPAAIPLAPGTTTDPAHSTMLLKAALDNIFATDIDERMMAHLPDYWRQYFNSKREHREFVPTDPHVVQVGGNVTRAQGPEQHRSQLQ